MQITGFQPNLINPSHSQKADSLLEKLASGKKVNSAADDAAGLQIIDRLTSELDAYQRGSQNGYDGVSLTQVADSAYGQIGESVAQIKELSIQAGNGALTDSDRQAIQGQITQLTEQINTIAEQSSFAGVNLLKDNGSIGINLGNGGSIDVQTKDAQTDLNGLGLNAIDVTTQAGAQSALGALDGIIDYVGTNRSELGATQHRLDAGIRNNDNQFEQLAAARGRRQDADFAQLTSERARNDILQQSQIAIQGQSNLNRQQALSLLS
jgi:flagellin